MEWSHGYNAALGYTYGYYKELSPTWIDYAILLSGRNPISAEKKRYLELGCGQGYNLILHAAIHQNVEFLGVDFNPLHIAHARELAKNCGLKNIRFEEADFLDLAKKWPDDYGQFHYAALHGIYSWVSVSLRHAIVECLKHALLPGGAVYLSYNTLPGWTSTLPLQYLLLRYGKTESLKPIAIIDQGLPFLKRMNDAGASMFRALPHLVFRLDKIMNLDRHYLIQEYLHEDAWHPLWFGQVVAEMSKAKLTPVSTATFPEIFLPQGLPENMKKVIEETDDPVFRQELIDCFINQSFRRDIFMRGEHKPWQLKQTKKWLETRFIALTKEINEQDGFKFSTSYGELVGKEEVYRPLFKALLNGPKSLDNLRNLPEFKDKKLGDIIHPLTLLVHGGYAALYHDDYDPKIVTRVNRLIASAVSDGAPYNFIACPKASQAMALRNIDFMFIDALIENPKLDEINLAKSLLNKLSNLGRTLAKDNQAISGEEAENYARELAKEFLNKTLPYLKNLGAL